MKIKAIIVEDEPLSQEVIKRYIADLPQIELVACCDNAIQGLEVIQNQKVDCVFLDINMPKLSGLNFLKSLSKPIHVIFTTAYPEYAVEGFELEAVDYLLKPYSFERFLKAVNKLQQKMATSAQGNFDKEFLIIKSDKRLHKIAFRDIQYFSATGDYVKVHTKDKVLITNERLKNIDDNLPEQHFIRIHKSYIIAIEAIDFVEGNRVKLGDLFLPVGQTYKEEMIQKLQS